MKEPKLYPRDYHLDFQQVGDHVEVHIMPLDITVSTAPGKMSTQDALDAAHSAIEERLKAEYDAAIAARAS
jgi:hypothetical protein